MGNEYLIKMYAYVAEMESVVAKIKGMEASNLHRASEGGAMMYGEFYFQEEKRKLEKIAKQLYDLYLDTIKE